MPNPKQIDYDISTDRGPQSVTGLACGRQQSLAVHRADLLSSTEFIVDHGPSGRRIAGFRATSGTEKMSHRVARRFGVELDGLLGGLLREKDHATLVDTMPDAVRLWILHCDGYGYVPFEDFAGG